VGVAPEELARAALDPVSLDCRLGGTVAHRNAEAGCGRGGRREVQHGEVGAELSSASQQRPEGVLAPEAVAPGKTFPPGTPRHH
jgi:hypothetical protein